MKRFIQGECRTQSALLPELLAHLWVMGFDQTTELGPRHQDFHTRQKLTLARRLRR